MTIQARSRHHSIAGPKKDRSKESRVRSSTRTMIERGQFDAMESRLPSRALRSF